MNSSSMLARLSALFIAVCFPASALACACGCGVFGVATNSLLPDGSRGQVYLEYDFQDQNRNWSGSSPAPAADNSDKDLRTDFFTLGGQYMINHDWAVMAEVPYWNRSFTTDTGDGIDTFHHSAFGDVRLMTQYTGFARDQSTGLIAGVKLPTGDWHYANFDRDTEIGTGSTDVLVGGFHRGAFTTDQSFGYIVQALGDIPVASQGGYTPGAEVDASAGLLYAGLSFAGGKVKVAPIAQVIVSVRGTDSGPQASDDGSGYRRLLLSPGVQVTAGKWKLYGDVEFPVAQHFNGNQLAAPALIKLILSHDF